MIIILIRIRIIIGIIRIITRIIIIIGIIK